ncbi:MAG: carotenoid oxygenase family protein [Leptolyngbya sp. SIO1E4]|nr:carotenoid oxygenase family protein [Leptolyngbya sp. SIO1E4]
MTPTSQANPFLTGNFAPVSKEMTTEPLPVIGEIPGALAGMFVRNGPNPQFPPIGQYHWFDGDGMVHGVHFQQGRAVYRNRFVQTEGFLKEQAAQKAIWSGLLEPLQHDLPEGSGKNTANTALIWHAGKFFALNEGGAPHALQLPELKTLGAYHFDGQLQSAVTAHPKVDPENGEMLFFGYSFAPPYLQYSVVSPEGALLRTEPIALPVGVMMHDFAITEHYIVFMDLPLTFRPERMAQGQPALAFERDRPSRFGLLPRDGSDRTVRWFEGPSCYVFHVLNAYEDGDEVRLLACRMQVFDLSGSGDPDAEMPYLHEWRFNLTSGAVHEAQLSALACEFPQINLAYTGRKMRYGYAAKVTDSPSPLLDGVIKFDFGDGTTTVQTQAYELGAGRYCGEAVFAPRPGATAEDDGWLLTFAHDQTANQSELLIFEAPQIETGPIARVILPQRVPYGFHGAWVSQSQIEAMVAG